MYIQFLLGSCNMHQGKPNAPMCSAPARARRSLLWHATLAGGALLATDAASTRVVYGLQFAGYMAGGDAANEPVAMFVHHVLACALLALSYARFSHVAMCVMFANDFADLWFEAAKLARYASRHRTSAALLAAFFLVHAGMRIVYVPLVVYKEWQASDKGRLEASLVTCAAALRALHGYWLVWLAPKTLRALRGEDGPSHKKAEHLKR